MGEKAPGKKNQQQQQHQQQHQNQTKNKKDKQNEKKKNQNQNQNQNQHQQQANSVKQAKHQKQAISVVKKKKEKTNKIQSKSPSKKSSGSFLEGFFLSLFFGSILLFFLYLVDYEKFVNIRNGAGVTLNKTLSVLPPEMVSKGRAAFEYIRPTAELTISKVSDLMNETSTFLNTNPLVKDHWANVRDISLICSERLLDYVRTLYLQVTGYCHDFKSKLF